jgi:ABC-type protease/lipase transport system fused ATPase/permease subunit
MIPPSLIVIAALVLISLAAILAAVVIGKSARSAKEENRELRQAFGRIEEKAEKWARAAGMTARLEEEADAQKAELSRTSDDDLINRANSLFSGMPEPPRD